jgi:heptosyltransferase-2
MMKKALIIQTAYIGDVILATPLIETLHLNFPECKIDFMLKKGNEVLLTGHPKLQKIYVFDKSKKRTSLLSNIREIRKNKYDLVINLHRYASSGIIAGFSGAKQIVGFKKNPISWMYTHRFAHDTENGQHEVDRNLSLLKFLCSDVVRRPKLYPIKEHYEKTNLYLKSSFICLAPSSVWKTKAAPIEKWLDIINLYKEKATIYLVGASTDFELCDSIIKKTDASSIVNLCGELSLMETAALFTQAKRVFVNDSGPLHIASAMNTPVTALFCSTVPSFGFGPLSEDSEVIEVKNLACRPCGLHGKTQCPEGHFKCGRELIIH